MEPKESASLIDQQRGEIGRSRHVEELEQGPAQAIGLSAHDGQRADALHGEDEEQEDRETGQGGEDRRAIGVTLLTKSFSERLHFLTLFFLHIVNHR